MPKSTNQKERIVETAMKLFATRGYASTPISLIAKKACVSQGLMYNFYASKEALLSDMMARGFEDIRTSMAMYANTNLTPHEAITQHVRSTVAIIRRKQEFWRLLHAVRLQGDVVKSMQKPFTEVVAQVTTTFTKVFRKIGYRKPELEAILFLAQIDGLVILFLQDNSIPLEKLAQQIIDRYQS